MIIFDRFLCCINLKTFGKFIGWIGATSSVLIAFVATLIFVVKSLKSRSLMLTTREYSEIFVKDFQPNLWVLFGLLIAAWLLIFVVHVLLIVGIKKKKSLAILPYILFSLVISAILICHVTEVVLAAIQNSEEAAEDADWTHNQTLLVVLLYTAAAGLFIFCIYFIMCIYSLYEIIRFEEKRRKYFRSFDLMAVDKNLK